MKSHFRHLLIVLAGLLAHAALADDEAWDYAVQVSAAVTVQPARISLTWVADADAEPVSYSIFRKVAGASEWGEAIRVSGNATRFVDRDVAVGCAYEYQVVKNTRAGYRAYGYVQAGIDVPLVEQRGKLVLVVDSTQADALAFELSRLEFDLIGDGWTVVRRDISRSAKPAEIKRIISAVYDADPERTKAVFLFGHVPVPYSGRLNPDGHLDHAGAWPADAYYGDMDGTWTDSSLSFTQELNSDPADAARLTNLPGDGKFDQTVLPSTVELQVGRVDLSRMPGRSGRSAPHTFASETELLRQYLNKDHDYRNRRVDVQRRAIVGDYFGVLGGESFAASGYRNFAPLVGSDRIVNLNREHPHQLGLWVPEMAERNYLFAYACGPGSYRSIGGTGNVGLYHDSTTVELVANDVQGAFTLMYGSWFGDWDKEDSLLRSPLATKSIGLASVWSGRPHWFIHPMGLGETIGAATRLTQNNNGLYRNQVLRSANLVHAALMGDPSLRLYPVAPPSDLRGVKRGRAMELAWKKSSDEVIGYHVYRASSLTGTYTRLNQETLREPAFRDERWRPGVCYMVRAVKRELSPSGSFFNASQGVFWTQDRSPSGQLAQGAERRNFPSMLAVFNR